MLKEIEMASFLEATNLSPTAKKEEIKDLCNNALAYNLFAVCVHPYYLTLAASLLEGSNTKLVTVAGFPLGGNDLWTKVRETELAVKNGAAEVDMVINLAALKNREYDLIIREVSAAVNCGITIKVIIETGYLEEDEVNLACACILEGGAHFIKTCTGFGPRGVTLQDVLLLRSLLPPSIGIKAAGGIKTAAFAMALIDAGANRLGTSVAETIMQQLNTSHSSTKLSAHPPAGQPPHRY